MCCGTEAGSYLRLVDSCITQLKAQGPSRTCNESKEEEDHGFPHTYTEAFSRGTLKRTPLYKIKTLNPKPRTPKPNPEPETQNPIIAQTNRKITATQTL